MTTSATSAATNVATVQTIGKGARLTESAVTPILALAGPAYDWSARGAVAGAVHVWACGEGKRPAVATGKAGAQTRTDYGRGVDALSAAIKRALSGKIHGCDLPPADDADDADDASSDDEAPATDDAPDYLALAVQAAATAVANGVDAADLLAAISAAMVQTMALAA